MSQLSWSSSNPALSGHPFDSYGQVYGAERTRTMTVMGTAGKASLLLAILSATAIWSWNSAREGNIPPGLLPGAAVVGFVIALVTIFKSSLAPYTAPLYAAVQGVVLGAISQVFEARYPGIATQAIMMTIGVTGSMLVVYGSGLIKVTDQLMSAVCAATGGIALVYMVSIVARMFGFPLPFLHDGSPISIGFSLFVVGLAAFNLLMDFEVIRRGEESGAPKSMEWYGAFSLMMTLIWLYMEILRLLSKLNRRN